MEINVQDVYPDSNVVENTQAIQNSIEQLYQNGGGTLHWQAGIYNISSIEIKSNVTFYLDAGVKIHFTDDALTFPVVYSRWEGVNRNMYRACIYSKNAHNIEITGHGTIDGAGAKWWQDFRNKSISYPRPFLISLEDSNNIKITGITLTNSPSWTIHPLNSFHIEINGIYIKNPIDSPNTDGIDADSSRDIRITNCLIDDGDDCIAIKSGTENSTNLAPSQNIFITNNIFAHGHGGIVLGSEMSGSIHNIVISDNIIQETDRGIRLKTRRGRGGNISHIVANNLIMDKVITPFAFNTFYGKSGSTQNNYLSEEAQPITELTPTVSDISMSNIIVTNALSIATFIKGLPEQPITNMTLANISITMANNDQKYEPEMVDDINKYAQAGLIIEGTKNLVLNNFNVNNIKGQLWLNQNNNINLVGEAQQN